MTFVDEFIHYAPDAAVYRVCVQSIVDDLIGRGVEVSLHFNQQCSRVESASDGTPSWVRIYPGSDQPHSGKDALWDLAHEWAHVKFGTASANERKTPQHERKIWDLAWSSLLNVCTEIGADVDDFERRRDDCLRTYDRQ